MSGTLDVAVVQVQSGADLASNLEQCISLVARAAELGAQLVVLPENFAFFGPDNERAELAESIGSPGPIQDALGAAATRYGLTIVGGGIPEFNAVGGPAYNTAIVVGEDGLVSASYRKIHLFDIEFPSGQVLRESATTSPGKDVVLVDVRGFRVGLTICYDVRFSGLFRALTVAGAEVLLVPAAFTLQTGAEHWHTLLKSRAIEFQCFVAAANQWGQHPKGRQSYGQSLLADPWGTVVAECGAGPGVVVSRFDKRYLEQVRARLPCAQHARQL